MRVNKNLLIKKTDRELEDYLKPNNGYVIDAIEYAVEILKERGYEFTEEQTAYIEIALLPKDKEEIHKDYIFASNLIFASAILGGVNFLIASATISNYPIFIGILSLLFISGIGLLARVGIHWLKYVMLALSILGLCILPFMILFIYNAKPILGLINLMQNMLQIIAAVFLFKAPITKPKINDVFST